MTFDETIDYAAQRSWWSEGDHPLEPAERTRLEHALGGAAAPERFARGRSDGRKAVWALHGEELVAVAWGWLGSTTRRVRAAEVRALEIEEGAHGWTLRAATAGERLALIAVAPSLGRPLAQAIGERAGTEVRFVASRRADRPRARVAEAAGTPTPSAGAPADRASPDGAVRAAAPTDLVAQLERAAALRAQGLLTDDEFAALKRRLLGA